MVEVRSNSDSSRPWLRWLAQATGFAIFAAYLALGTLALLMLLIFGLWAGFGRQSYVLMFFGVVLYVYGTAWLAFSFGRRPGLVRGGVLVLLVMPVIISIAQTMHVAVDMNAVARTYLAADDPQATAAARETLLEQGRRAGRHGYIDVLLEGLHEAEDDARRRRLVGMLGELSYQHEPLLETLRALYEETRGDPERAQLHQASIEALRGVNPYEQELPEPQAPPRSEDRSHQLPGIEVQAPESAPGDAPR